MTVQPTADLDGLKTRIRATWMAGDYGSVAALTESAAKYFIDRRQIKPNMQVLDVAEQSSRLSGFKNVVDRQVDELGREHHYQQQEDPLSGLR